MKRRKTYAFAGSRVVLLAAFVLMALVSGPSRGGNVSTGGIRHELELVTDKHVEYIRNLDTVRVRASTGLLTVDNVDRGKMSWTIGRRSTFGSMVCIGD